MADTLKTKTINGVIWSSIERFSVSGVNFIFGLILARLLTPSDYGIIAMLTIFMAIAQTFIDSGFSNALIRKPNRTEIDNSTAFYFNIVVGLFCYIVLFFSAPLIASFYNTPILVPLTRILGINLILNSLCVVQQALLSIKLDFKTQAKVSLIAALISGVISIICAYYGMGVWSLVVQAVLTASLRTVLLWGITSWRPSKYFSKHSFKTLFSFGSKLLLSGILDTIYNNLYTIIIGKKFTTNDLGLYARADHLAQFPSVNINGVLQRVSFPSLSTIQDDAERLNNSYEKILRLTGFIIFPIMLGIATVAKPLIRLILTEKWIECAPYLQVLCVAMMWFPINAVYLSLIQVKNRPNLYLRLEIYKKIVGTIILFITIPFGMMAMCVGRIVSSFLSLFINAYYSGKLIDISYSRQMHILIPSLINSIIMCLLMLFIQAYFHNNTLQLIIPIIFGIIYYSGSNYLMKSSEWKELTQIMKSILN